MPFPPILGKPIGVKKGTSSWGLGIWWNGTPGALLGWKPLKVVLRTRTTGEVLWEQLWPSNANRLSPSVFYPLNGVPDWVEYAELWSEGLLLVRSGPFGMVNVQLYSTQSTPSEEFIVLDEPKVPMSPAWVSVLRYSCVWARQANTAERAAELSTQQLWISGVWLAFDTLNGLQGCTRNHTDSGETFHLRVYLGEDNWRLLHGQCNDLADFLVCLFSGIGSYPLRSQRTYSLSQAYFRDDPDGAGWQFVTNTVDPAGSAPQQYGYTIAFHQFTVHDNRVWDASFAFLEGNYTRLSIGWARDTEYRRKLIRQYQEWRDGQPFGSPVPPDHPNAPWQPTPAGGFIPSVSTAPLPIR
ncbi:MAG: hypothetical protein C4335_04370 [Armatimonadota bacterium]